ncbi:hypothetical protein [Pleionea sediminis]|uniref:hypothetical protein n=1 Tax=Pleionea sediminis TaxID=2569479 RepID=UPI0011864942|nr:hypothetical protein [Pleionea sediminis]
MKHSYGSPPLGQRIKKLAHVFSPAVLSIAVASALPGSSIAGDFNVDIDRASNSSWKLAEKRSGKRAIKLTDKKQEATRSLKSSIPIDDSIDTYLLGGGYDSERGEFKGATSVYVSALPAEDEDGNVIVDVDANNDGFVDSAQFVGNTQLDLYIGVDQNYEKLLNSIRGSASANISAASFEVSGDVGLAFQNSADEFTSSYTLITRATPRKPVLLPLEPEGETAVGSGNGLHPTSGFMFWAETMGYRGKELAEFTGDEFIQGVELGAWLMVNIQFKFRNAEDKKNIGGRLSVDWAQGTVSVDGEADYSAINNSETVDVTIRAYQYGGDSGSLLSILDDQTSHACTLRDPNTCLGYFENTVLYAKDKLPGVVGFPSQFKNSDGEWLYNKFNPVRYLTASYEDSGPEFRQYFSDPLDKLTFASRQALRDIKTRWERSVMHQQRANYLSSQRVADLKPGQLTIVRDIENRASNNAYHLSELAKDCLTGGPNDCATWWSSQNFLQSYDVTALEY